MIDERSEAIGYAEYYAMERGVKQGRAEGEAAIRWLLEEVVTQQWNDSWAVIQETLESMTAPSMVLHVVASLVD